MKHFLIAMAIATAAVTTPALAADVGISVSIGQPGFYGRIDIGDYPRPRVIYRQPIIVERVRVVGPPVYLRVPPGHAKNWKKHCREYNACGERVFFVHDDWYEREYVPRYQEKHRDRGDGRHDEDRNDDHGRQEKNGNGHGKGKDHDRGR
ncbi:MAG: hypothetical protein WCZ86_08040 [Desulfurivibrionaceae bacterium]|jgi:hypothetical protein